MLILCFWLLIYTVGVDFTSSDIKICTKSTRGKIKKIKSAISLDSHHITRVDYLEQNTIYSFPDILEKKCIYSINGYTSKLDETSLISLLVEDDYFLNGRNSLVIGVRDYLEKEELDRLATVFRDHSNALILPSSLCCVADLASHVKERTFYLVVSTKGKKTVFNLFEKDTNNKKIVLHSKKTSSLFGDNILKKKIFSFLEKKISDLLEKEGEDFKTFLYGNIFKEGNPTILKEEVKSEDGKINGNKEEVKSEVGNKEEVISTNGDFFTMDIRSLYDDIMASILSGVTPYNLVEIYSYNKYSNRRFVLQDKLIDLTDLFLEISKYTESIKEEVNKIVEEMKKEVEEKTNGVSVKYILDSEYSSLDEVRNLFKFPDMVNSRITSVSDGAYKTEEEDYKMEDERIRRKTDTLFTVVKYKLFMKELELRREYEEIIRNMEKSSDKVEKSNKVEKSDKVENVTEYTKPEEEDDKSKLIPLVEVEKVVFSHRKMKEEKERMKKEEERKKIGKENRKKELDLFEKKVKEIKKWEGNEILWSEKVKEEVEKAERYLEEAVEDDNILSQKIQDRRHMFEGMMTVLKKRQETAEYERIKKENMEEVKEEGKEEDRKEGEEKKNIEEVKEEVKEKKGEESKPIQNSDGDSDSTGESSNIHEDKNIKTERDSAGDKPKSLFEKFKIGLGGKFKGLDKVNPGNEVTESTTPEEKEEV